MTNDPHDWMWSEALSMLARAERMHQQMFTPVVARRQISWEPPVDVLETEREVLVLAALPGVDVAKVEAVDRWRMPGNRRAARAAPRAASAMIHRLELPQGRFERRVPLPPGRYAAVRRAEAHGCLRHQFVEVEAMTPQDDAPKTADTGPPAPTPRAEAPKVETPAPQATAAPGPRFEARGPSAPSDAMIVVPVRSMVLFPEIVLPITIGRPLSVDAAQAAVREQRQILVAAAEGPERRRAGAGRPHEVGTVANILRYVTAPDGAHHIICQGVQRFRITEFVARLALPGRQGPAPARAARPAARTSRRASCCCASSRWRCCSCCRRRRRSCAWRSRACSRRRRWPTWRPPTWTSTPSEKQEILETADLVARLDKVSHLLAHRLEVLKLSAEIGRQTRASLDDRQREVLLREQMAAIQKQLGEGDGNAAEIAELEKAIDDAGMPEEVEKQAKKELRRLQRMPDASAEYGMIRTYLDWLIELPWKAPPPLTIDIAEARKILDADHYGLEKIKTRIIEYLAVRKLAPEGKAPILCFVGPPGVGKTSLGQSIARALGRPFVRTSLGGVHDEAEIRGHRRTYIGALPGNIIQAIRKAGSRGA